MTPTDIEIVQQSFAEIAPIDDEMGVRFYQRLFEIAPEVRAYFRGDMEDQARMFMSMLGVAVNGLSNFDYVAKDLRDLAIRHVGYGVKPEHFAPVREALLWVLEQSLGAGFTDEVRNAWRAVYDGIAEDMIDEAYGAGSA